MPCERYRDALTDAAAGGAATPALEAHLGSCAACAAELAELQRLMAAADTELSALAVAEPSPALRSRIREAVAAPVTAPAFRWGFAWTATAAAVLALAVLGVWRMSVAREPASPTVAVNAPSAPASAAPTVEPSASAAPSSVAVAGVPASADPAAARFPSESIRKAKSVRRVVAAHRPVVTEPEVLVPPGEQEAFLRFASHLQTRVVTDESILVADLSGPMPEPKPLEIPPLSVTASDSDSSGTD